ncbi:MAG TPA: hypothetical protein EYG86_04075 [Crocinitomicaceae bacterium]|nr:hypothetical protein [Crocinitomicaceae bacterium]
MKQILLLLALSIITYSNSQVYTDTTVDSGFKRILLNNRKGFSIGSYGEAHYNAPIEKGKFKNGTADLHRLILYTGYRFNSKLQFFSEMEIEHINEVSIEQAFVNYQFNSTFNFKAGVLLIPMGYVNEFHEPTLFNGVERPSVDKYVIPSTWRELGLGFHGLLKPVSVKYQVFVVNGFKGFDGSAKFSGKSGLRGGRQKAAKAIVRTPSVTGKLTFFGVNGLRLGVSGYYGNSESTLYDGVNRDSTIAVAKADSSSVGIGIVAVNLDYSIKNFTIRAEGVLASVSNTEQYNTFTSSTLGQQIMGYYGELSYKHSLKKNQQYPQLIPFVRYENYDTHYKLDRNMVKNNSYNREVLTAGIGYQLTAGTIFKFDYQWLKNGSNPRPTGLLNIGFGYWF